MSIALTNRVKELEQQLAEALARIDKLEKLTTPRPVGRPRKDDADPKVQSAAKDLA